MATAQISNLHAAHSRALPAQQNKFSPDKARSLSSSSTLSRGAFPCNSNWTKIESNNKNSRLCSPLAAAASSVSLNEEEDDNGMEWLSPVSENPMEKWLQQKGDEREGDAWREECGVVAIFGDPEASRLCYLSLHALQHRGQEGAGIVTANEHTLHAVTGKPKKNEFSL